MICRLYKDKASREKEVPCSSKRDCPILALLQGMAIPSDIGEGLEISQFFVGNLPKILPQPVTKLVAANNLQIHYRKISSVHALQLTMGQELNALPSIQHFKGMYTFATILFVGSFTYKSNLT